MASASGDFAAEEVLAQPASYTGSRTGTATASNRRFMV
ncbi:hypothetical protein D187_008509 [Cystobacter fuscus DSM 2262]|uniref:Uncharacterized protein n=1 Tax=Cystobacter fuscus (strain ATCC 25194 / DSM 2262 / NBRC 100088 / M29) TaxID=1242864 RepID=S9PIT0_CYSF2|nr:hypothetical protein D187_008509 [Cystobacter fuscus DSM 2262]